VGGLSGNGIMGTPIVSGYGRRGGC
jgi:hypothetical protein